MVADYREYFNTDGPGCLCSRRMTLVEVGKDDVISVDLCTAVQVDGR